MGLKKYPIKKSQFFKKFSASLNDFIDYAAIFENFRKIIGSHLNNSAGWFIISGEYFWIFWWSYYISASARTYVKSFSKSIYIGQSFSNTLLQCFYFTWVSFAPYRIYLCSVRVIMLCNAYTVLEFGFLDKISSCTVSKHYTHCAQAYAGTSIRIEILRFCASERYERIHFFFLTPKNCFGMEHLTENWI